MNKKQQSRFIDGKEVLDDRPVAIPLRIQRIQNQSMSDRIREIVRSEQWRNAAQARDVESFEEADDFDVDDDFDPQSPWEEQFEGQYDRQPPPEAAREGVDRPETKNNGEQGQAATNPPEPDGNPVGDTPQD